MTLAKKLPEWKGKVLELEALKKDNKKINNFELSDKLATEILSKIDIDVNKGEFHRGGNSVKFEGGVWSNEGQVPSYSVSLGVSVDEGVGIDLQAIVQGTFDSAKSVKLGVEKGQIEYGLSYDPDSFQRAKKFPGNFLDGKLTITASASTAQPYQKHDMEVQTKGATMELTASGNYRNHLDELVAEIKPQIADIQFTGEDAERVIRKINTINPSKASKVEESLKPQERGMKVSIGSQGLSFEPNETIELRTRVADIGKFEELIGKSLIAVPYSQQSRVNKFTKAYTPVALLKGQRLKDLQFTARTLDGLDIGVRNFGVQEKDEEINSKLERRIDALVEQAKDDFWRPEAWMYGLVKQYCGKVFARRLGNLGSIHGDAEIIVPLLKEVGYVPLESLPKAVYPRQDTGRHLVEFVRQMHARDPSQAIAEFRKENSNREPSLTIVSDSGKIDASKVRKIIVPDESKLYKFSMDERKGAYGLSNSINVSSPAQWYGRRSDIYLKFDLNRPTLIEAQDKALSLAGITIS